jgi:hypothetical protein
LRKDITTSSNSSSNEQPNGLDINLDTILNNYPYVKTECFSYEDSGDINNFQPTNQQQILQPQSNVTTTSILLESTLSASNDLISYTDVSNNNGEWSMEQSEIKDWETNEAISSVSNYYYFYYYQFSLHAHITWCTMKMMIKINFFSFSFQSFHFYLLF